MHVREQIVAAVTLLLRNALTDVSVYQGRAFSQDREVLPSVNVSFTTDEIETEVSAYRHELSLTTAIRVRQGIGADTAANQIAEDIEKAIIDAPEVAAFSPGALVDSTTYVAEGEGAKELAVITITFNVQYFTRPGAPDVPVGV